jgi:hypothetical protein
MDKDPSRGDDDALGESPSAVEPVRTGFGMGMAMESSTLGQVTTFFDRYRTFAAQLQTARIGQFQSEFGRLQAGLEPLLAAADEQRKLIAAKFNMFHLLGIARSEVNTHSALLANLLDPEGDHAQQHLFLRKFLQVCQSKFPKMPMPPGEIVSGKWVVEKEKVTPQGNLDLVISCPKLQYLLVIENKVDAIEQEKQLARYAQWMQGRSTRYTHQALAYLTPEGRASWTNAGHLYYRLSYREDIKTWLEACLPEVKAPRVRETLAQYLEIVRAL